MPAGPPRGATTHASKCRQSRGARDPPRGRGARDDLTGPDAPGSTRCETGVDSWSPMGRREAERPVLHPTFALDLTPTSQGGPHAEERPAGPEQHDALKTLRERIVHDRRHLVLPCVGQLLQLGAALDDLNSSGCRALGVRSPARVPGSYRGAEARSGEPAPPPCWPLGVERSHATLA